MAPVEKVPPGPFVFWPTACSGAQTVERRGLDMANRDTGDEDGQRLLKRFDRERDDRAVATELVTRLRVLMLAHLRKHWRLEAHAWGDIESGALVRLVEWRQEGQLKHWEGSLGLLAYRLIAAEVHLETAHRRREMDLQDAINAEPEIVFAPAVSPERAA